MTRQARVDVGCVAVDAAGQREDAGEAGGSKPPPGLLAANARSAVEDQLPGRSRPGASASSRDSGAWRAPGIRAISHSWASRTSRSGIGSPPRACRAASSAGVISGIASTERAGARDGLLAELADLPGPAGRAARIAARPARSGTASRGRRRGAGAPPAARRSRSTSLSASVAWMVPSRPGSTPSTPRLGAGRDLARARGATGRGSGSRGLRPSTKTVACPSKRKMLAWTLGLPGQHAGVVHQVAGGEAVGAVQHQVVVADQRERVPGVETPGGAARRPRRAGSGRAAGRGPTPPWAAPRPSCRGAPGAGGSSRRPRRSRPA